MFRKKTTLLIISLIIIVFYSIIVNNIELNRMIYDSVEASSNNAEGGYRIYDLDDMEKELDSLEEKSINAEKYKNTEVSGIVKPQYVPRERILFNLNPFDFRLETRNYKVYINYKIINNAIGSISSFTNKAATKFEEGIDEIVKVKDSIKSLFSGYSSMKE
ncbi:MAG: hypothetical protein Q8936_05365 [Bacillota bacterium]|nr:hypothetical protein [Bacillota bacterium]